MDDPSTKNNGSNSGIIQPPQHLPDHVNTNNTTNTNDNVDIDHSNHHVSMKSSSSLLSSFLSTTELGLRTGNTMDQSDTPDDDDNNNNIINSNSGTENHNNNNNNNKRYKPTKMIDHDDELATATTTTTAPTKITASPLPSQSSKSTTTTTMIHHPTSHTNNNNNHSFIIFSSSICRSIVTKERMAPVYIGISPIRPETEKSSNTKNNTTTLNPSLTIATQPTNSSSPSPLQTPPSQEAQSSVTVPIVYKVQNPDGTERRMTAQEKKIAKMQYKLLLKQQQQPQQDKPIENPNNVNIERANSSSNEGCVQPIHTQMESNHDMDDTTTMIQKINNNNHHETNTNDRYVPILQRIDTKNNDTSLEENRIDNDGIPPIMLAPPMAQLLVLPQQHQQQLSKQNMNHHVDTISTTPNMSMEMDIPLSELWGQSLLQHSILPAEYIRQQETNIRCMPYHIVPQVWTRLRPQLFHNLSFSTTTTMTNHHHHHDTVNSTSSGIDNTNQNNDNTNDTNPSSQDWMWCDIYQSNHVTCIPNDQDNNNYNDAVNNRNAILEFLHHPSHVPQLHISDGTKFGCDFLLYDGPRQERHAFAGLRIVSPQPSSSQQCTTSSSSSSSSSSTTRNTKDYDDHHSMFPIHPNAYDLAGYVRCLNTAGKLALLATSIVVNERDTNIHNHTTTTTSTTTTSSTSTQPPPPQQQKQRRKILILDLALEKIAMTTSRRPKKTMEQRLKNLNKTTKATKST